MSPEQLRSIPPIAEMIEDPPAFLADGSVQIGATVAEGIQEVPAYIAFARDNGTVYHTYTITAPDPFVAPYHSFLLDRTALGDPTGEGRAWRKDEYPD